MARTIYLAVFTNGARPAHWAIFIPTSTTALNGKVIHVTGNKALGFFLEFKRNYDLECEERQYQLIPLAEVDESYIRDTPGNGAETKDTIARDRLESLATTVPPPGPNPRPFDPGALGCQYWLEQYTKKLSADGYVPEEVSSVIATAPRKL